MPNVARLPTPAEPRAWSRRDAAVEERKRSFLRMVSHELRTPLNSILGFSEILASELYGPHAQPQYQEYAEIIRGSGQKLLKLVNQVLEIARLEGQTEELTPRAEPLDAALDDAAIGLKDEIAAREVRITVVGECDLPSVMADPRGLRTVLGNLLQNAVTFSPQGGEIRVSAEVRGSMVEIAIEDEGQGLKPDDLQRMLRPFEQAENALTRRSEGAGLGLPICDLTCQAMGGRLRLACEPGAGLRALVQLPLA